MGTALTTLWRLAMAGAAAALAIAFAIVPAAAQGGDAIALTHPAIQYARAANDRVARLLQRSDGVSTLTPDGKAGYLRSILAALDVPVESQILRFASASVQGALIRHDNPRALYFNESSDG